MVKKASIELSFDGFPSSWNALSTKQIRQYIRYMMIRLPEIIDFKTKEIINSELYLDCYLNLIRLWSGHPKKYFFKMTGDQARLLTFEWKLLDFLFVENNLIINPCPKVKVWYRLKRYVLYAPPEDLRHTITADEFRFADRAYEAFKLTQEIKYLDQLLAVMLRPKARNYSPISPDTTGDPREEFNNNTIQHRMNIVSAIPVIDKYAIYLWYDGCRSQFPKAYPEVFSGKNEEKASLHGWTAVYENIAGPALGTVTQIGKMILSRVLLSCEMRLRQAKKVKK